MEANSSRAQHWSTDRPENFPLSQGGSYVCALYEDHLFLTGTRGPQEQTSLCFYDLKNLKAEDGDNRRNATTLHSFDSTSACFYLDQNQPMIFCYGRMLGRRTSHSHQYTGLMIDIFKDRDYFTWTIQHPMHGPGTPSSLCHIHNDQIYVYDPTEENANFGTLESCTLMNRGEDWVRFQASSDNMRLKKPSKNALFINGILYVLTENVDLSGRTVVQGESLVEDIYTLDLKRNHGNRRWERTSSSGETPGALSNISLAEAHGVIYVFGSSEGKPVLWIYNINDKEWKQVRDVNTLIAGPNQKAVIYKEQLLIIDWGYSKNSIEIQYFSLDDLSFVGANPNGKDICQDKPENFIQKFKNLYESKLFPDVTFEVEGEEIYAHKGILAHRSDYFLKVFTSGMSESHSAKIVIPNMKSYIFKAILQYIYCNEVELDEQLALDLIPVVGEYLMEGLQELCEKYLCKQLRKENVVDMLIVADRHEIEELKKTCFKYILKNLDNIDENEEMMKLSKPLFLELLKSGFSSSSQQKSHPKSEKKEEKKSNYDERSSGRRVSGSGLREQSLRRVSASKRRSSIRKSRGPSRSRSPKYSD